MQVRLAFSIAIRANSSILLLDEVLAVGDEAFQRKCYNHFESLKRNKKTVVIVTHDMAAVEKFCNKAILIEKGSIIEQGQAEVVAKAYSDMLSPETNKYEPTIVDEEAAASKRFGDMRLKFDKVSVVAEKLEQYGSKIQIRTTVACNEAVKDEVVVAYALKDSVGQKLFGEKIPSSELSKMTIGDSVDLEFSFPNILNKGRYFIDVSLYLPGEDLYTDCWIDCTEFSTKTKGTKGYPVVVDSKFQEHRNISSRAI
jgi:ABC-2 type transport system ATP-binding protein